MKAQYCVEPLQEIYMVLGAETNYQQGHFVYNIIIMTCYHKYKSKKKHVQQAKWECNHSQVYYTQLVIKTFLYERKKLKKQVIGIEKTYQDYPNAISFCT